MLGNYGEVNVLWVRFNGGQSVSTDGRSVIPSLMDSHFAGGQNTVGKIEILTD